MAVQPTHAQESGGHLVIIGGGLRHDNQSIFQALIQFAGGPDRANFVVLPTASISIKDSYEFCEELTLHGVQPGRAQVLNVTEHNASTSTADASILEKVRSATGLFISGGDQRRLVRALTNRDGSDTPLLTEFRKLLARGGVIGGTSAGASGQSEVMLAVSGLPSMLLDEGMDTLDYGIKSDERERGLLITKGLGFFKMGIIDQHFYKFRGRLGRLTRAVDHCRVPYGFGIDENTALVVEPTGLCRVIGTGFVTIIQPPATAGKDDPLGYRVEDVWLSALSDGDTFDPRTKQMDIASSKLEQPIEKAEYNGNFLINDINGASAGHFALISGLAENQKNRQDAIAIKYHGDTTHGYRFVLSKRAESKSYVGQVNRSWTYSLTNLRLDITPIANGLKPSDAWLPDDLPSDPLLRRAIIAANFRGLLCSDASRHFRPADAITHGELAHALSQATHLYATSPEITRIADVDWQTLEGGAIHSVVAAGLMAVDAQNRFRPSVHASAIDVAHSLRKLALRDRDQLETGLAKELDQLEQSQQPNVRRDQVAAWLHTILRLP